MPSERNDAAFWIWLRLLGPVNDFRRYHHDDLTVFTSAVFVISPDSFAMFSAISRASAFVGNFASNRRASSSS